MRRNFKFRVWSKKDNAMYKILNLATETDAHLAYKGSKKNTRMLQPGDDHSVVMQWTGVMDKNGLEIYEGDVVDIKDKYPKQEGPGAVDHGVINFANGCYVVQQADGTTLPLPYYIFTQGNNSIYIVNLMQQKQIPVSSRRYEITVVGNVWEGDFI